MFSHNNIWGGGAPQKCNNHKQYFSSGAIFHDTSTMRRTPRRPALHVHFGDPEDILSSSFYTDDLSKISEEVKKKEQEIYTRQLHYTMSHPHILSLYCCILPYSDTILSNSFYTDDLSKIFEEVKKKEQEICTRQFKYTMPHPHILSLYLLI